MCRERDDSRGRPPLAYQRRGFPWYELAHPFVQRRVSSVADGFDVFRSPVAGAVHGLVADHVVQGRVLFPGAGYLEVARAAAPARAALQGVYFLRPLAVEAAGLFIECSVGNGRFEVRSDEGDGTTGVAVHCSGALVVTASSPLADEHPLARVRLSSSHVAHVDALYDAFDAIGMTYGAGYRTLVRLWDGERDATARLRARSTHEGTHVHPADLDDALCAGVAIGARRVEARLPFAVDDARLQAAVGELWAAVSQQGAEAVSVRLGAHGLPPQAQLGGFKVRALRAEAAAQRHLYVSEWRVAEVPVASTGSVLVMLGSGDPAARRSRACSATSPTCSASSPRCRPRRGRG